MRSMSLVSWWFTVGSLLFVASGLTAFTTSPVTAVLNFLGATVFTGGAALAWHRRPRLQGFRPNRTSRSGAIALTDVEGPLPASSVSAHQYRTPRAHNEPATINLALAVQLVSAGVFFQIAMSCGLLPHAGWLAEDVWVWTPAVLGSVGFVWSSTLSVLASPVVRPARLRAWANLGGSAAFLAGSVLGYFAQGPVIIPPNDIDNPVFLLGSLLFLYGSIEPHKD